MDKQAAWERFNENLNRIDELEDECVYKHDPYKFMDYLEEIGLFKALVKMYCKDKEEIVEDYIYGVFEQEYEGGQDE